MQQPCIVQSASAKFQRLWAFESIRKTSRHEVGPGGYSLCYLVGHSSHPRLEKELASSDTTYSERVHKAHFRLRVMGQVTSPSTEVALKSSIEKIVLYGALPSLSAMIRKHRHNYGSFPASNAMILAPPHIADIDFGETGCTTDDVVDVTHRLYQNPASEAHDHGTTRMDPLRRQPPPF